MPVYVDSERIPYGHMRMSHMVADTLKELHEMADKLGLNRKWFQGPPAHAVPHYDVCEDYRNRAIALGAKVIDRREMVAHIKRNRAALTVCPSEDACLRQRITPTPPESMSSSDI